MFIGTKRSRSILYSISTNTQWGLIPFYINDKRKFIAIYSSFKGTIHRNFLLFIPSYFNFLFMNLDINIYMIKAVLLRQ